MVANFEHGGARKERRRRKKERRRRKEERSQASLPTTGPVGFAHAERPIGLAHAERWLSTPTALSRSVAEQRGGRLKAIGAAHAERPLSAWAKPTMHYFRNFPKPRIISVI